MSKTIQKSKPKKTGKRPKPANTKGTDASRYLDGSITKIDGYGVKGAKSHPFNYTLAMEAFNEWAFAAATLNADAAAGVPLRLYTRAKSKKRKNFETRTIGTRTLNYLTGQSGGVRGAGKPSGAVLSKVIAFGGEIEEVIEPHPALTLLQRPNEDDNGYEMSVERFIDLQATGNFWWYVRDWGSGPLEGQPAQLFRLPPQWTRIIPNESKLGSRRVQGYSYGKRNDTLQFYNPDEVDHWKFYPGDFFYGKGWFEAVWRSLKLDDAKRTEDLAFKDNMSRPDWLLSVEGGNPDTLDRLSTALNKQHQGPRNAGKHLIVKGKMTATALQFELKELGTPTRVIEAFAAASKVPVAILLSNDPTKAGSVSAKLSWYRTGVRPLCMRDEEKLNQRYLTRFDGAEDYFLAYDHVSFEDEEAVRKSSIASLAGGQLTVDESRAEIGYGPTKGGDDRYMPSGTTGTASGVVGNLATRPSTGVANG